MLRRSLLAALLLVLPLAAQETMRPSPDFAVRMPDGGQLLLSQFKGKVILAAFISTTCPHCQQYIQSLNTLVPELAPKGVQIIGIAFNDNAGMLVNDFVRRFRPVFPVGSCTREQAVNYLQLSPMKPGYVPQVIFVDRKFNIRAHYTGDNAFFNDGAGSTRAMLTKLLNESVPASSKARPKRAAAKKS